MFLLYHNFAVRCYNEWKADGCPRSNLSRSWTAHKNAKCNFRREIKKVQRNFEKDEINRLLKTADCDINKFWRTIKKHRNGDQAKTCAVRNPAGKVVYETEEIIPVWKNHFSSLCTPNFDAEYDQEHFRNVTESVKKWSQEVDSDDFLEAPFSVPEVAKCIKGLNKGKSPGFDFVTAEHLQYAGVNFVRALTLIINRIIELEFIPRNFRSSTI